jgi:endoglucanase
MDIWSREWKEKQKIFISYSHEGKVTEDRESLAHYGTQVAFFSVVNPYIAEQIYKQKILSQWNKDGFWGDKNNYYDQNWVWFGTALYTDNLPNLWTYKTN